MPTCPCGDKIKESLGVDVSERRTLYNSDWKSDVSTRGFINAIKKDCKSITPCEERKCSKYLQKSESYSTGCSIVGGVLSFFGLGSAGREVCGTAVRLVNTDTCVVRDGVCAVEGAIKTVCSDTVDVAGAVIPDISFSMDGNIKILEVTSASSSGGQEGLRETIKLAITVKSITISVIGESLTLPIDLTIYGDCTISARESLQDFNLKFLQKSANCAMCIPIPELDAKASGSILSGSIGNVLIGICISDKGFFLSAKASVDITGNFGDGITASIADTITIGIPLE
jgi:hypothetical protein